MRVEVEVQRRNLQDDGVVEEEEGVFAFHCKGLGVKNNYNNKKNPEKFKIFLSKNIKTEEKISPLPF